MKTLKITKKTYINDKIKVHDIEVRDAHHYFLKNGIISHNSIGGFIPQDVMSGGGGPLYNASFITFLYKSQLKEDKPAGEGDVDIKTTGIIVRSAVKKGRFARPIQIRFHISFYKGMNPFVGLEQFINWKSCGIEKGIVVSEKDFAKWNPEDKQKAIDNNWEFEFDGKKSYFYPKSTARNIVVKHLGIAVAPWKLFTPEILTEDILKQLDENVIKPTFQLPNINDIYDVEEFADTLFIADDNTDNSNIE